MGNYCTLFAPAMRNWWRKSTFKIWISDQQYNDKKDKGLCATSLCNCIECNITEAIKKLEQFEVSIKSARTIELVSLPASV